MSEPIGRSMRDQVIFVVALLAALLAALVLGAPAQAKPLSKADRAFVDRTVETAMEEEGQPGVAISISGPAGNYTKAYGVRDLETGKRMKLGDHIRIGSITKTFTATAVLREVEQGHMRLTDPLDKWIEGIPNGSLITVRDLLAMRSGAFEYEADPTLQQEFGENPLTPFGPEDFLRIMRENEPYAAPDEVTMYVNSNYWLLGLILEKVTGESAAAVITKEVIKPLKLHHTSFPTTADMPRPYAQGYCGTIGALENCTAFNPDLFFTDGAIVSTVPDLAKYSAALGTGRLLSPAMEAERLRVTYVPYSFEGPPVFGYGLGIISFGNWLGHDGSVPGYGTEAMYEPQNGAVIAGAETLQTGPLSVFSRIYERIAAHLYPESLEDAEAYPEYSPEPSPRYSPE